MADWMLRCADLLKPLYDRLHELILNQPVIAAHETTLKWSVKITLNVNTPAGCCAHNRRKFVETKAAKDKKSSGREDWVLNHIQKLYRIEAPIKSETLILASGQD